MEKDSCTLSLVARAWIISGRKIWRAPTMTCSPTWTASFRSQQSSLLNSGCLTGCVWDVPKARQSKCIAFPCWCDKQGMRNELTLITYNLYTIQLVVCFVQASPKSSFPDSTSVRSSAGLAERTFESKRRDFQRFLERVKPGTQVRHPEGKHHQLEVCFLGVIPWFPAEH